MRIVSEPEHRVLDVTMFAADGVGENQSDEGRTCCEGAFVAVRTSGRHLKSSRNKYSEFMGASVLLTLETALT